MLSVIKINYPFGDIWRGIKIWQYFLFCGFINNMGAISPLNSAYIVTGNTPDIFKVQSTRPAISQIVQNDGFIKTCTDDEKLFFPEGVSNMLIRQGRIGNCQSLAVIDAFSRNKTGAEILKNMVKSSPDGKSIDVYFACMDGKPINVTHDEIEDVINHESTIFRKAALHLTAPLFRKFFDVEISVGERSLGVRAIEIAYAKYMKMTNPDTFKDDKPKNVYNNKKYHSSSYQFIKDTMGPNAKTFVSYETKPRKHHPPLNSISQDEKEKLAQVLEDAAKNPDKYIITCCTTDDCSGKFVSWHDYSIRSVNISHEFLHGNTIVLVNPWDNTKTKEISVEEFMKNFESLSYIKT